MNKQNLWFLTLFSLILVLGVYYITLPSEIFSDSKTEKVSKNIDVHVSETNKLVALRVERNEKLSTVMSELQDKIINATNSEEKNSAFEELQNINISKGRETYLEDMLQEKMKINSFIEIMVTIASKDHNNSIANEIMNTIQEEFEDKKNITIKFES